MQTSVDICKNVNLNPEMCLRGGGGGGGGRGGGGCLVADQGGSDKVAQFKIEGRGSGLAAATPKQIMKFNSVHSVHSNDKTNYTRY